MRHLVSLATMLLLVCVATARAASPERIALVIGNGGYQHVERLRNPANDARLMADTLRRLGFTLVGGGAQIDLDRAGMEAALRRFHAAIAPGSVAFFYYSGHGVQVGGGNYLVPVGAAPERQRDVPVQMLAADLVLQDMADAGAGLNIVVLDACRNNPFAELMAADGARGIRTADGTAGAAPGDGLAEMHAPAGTLISFATQPGGVAFDGAAGAPDSPYTAALARALAQPGLEVVRAFNRAGVEVGRLTGRRQDPWLAISSLQDEVFLAGRTGGAAAAALTEPAPEPMESARAAAVATGPALARPDPTWCPPAGTQAIRDSAVTVRYQGEAPGAPGFCVAEIDGTRQVLVDGIWPAAWPGAMRAAAALGTVLASPPGVQRSFQVQIDVSGLRDTVRSEGWRFTLTNEGPATQVVAGLARAAHRLRWEERNLSSPYQARAEIVLDDATGAVLAQRFRVLIGGQEAAYDFWSAFGGGLASVPDFSVTALN